MSSRLRNVTSGRPLDVTTCDIRNRTTVTYATNVTGQRGKPGRGLDAVGGCFPLRQHQSRRVTTTRSDIPSGGVGGDSL